MCFLEVGTRWGLALCLGWGPVGDRGREPGRDPLSRYLSACSLHTHWVFCLSGGAPAGSLLGVEIPLGGATHSVLSPRAMM